MLYSELATEVRERLGEDSADFWTDAYIQRQLLNGMQRFCREERWTWLLSLQTNVPVAAGTSELELVDDVDATRHFALAMKPTGDLDDTRLALPTKIAPAKGYQLRISYTQQGKPLYFYTAKMQINTYPTGDKQALAIIVHFIPTPDVNYTAEYMYYRQPLMAWDVNKEPEVPEPYQDAVVAWATAMCWLKELNGGGKAQEQFNLYNAVLAQARKDQKELADDEELAWGGEEPQMRATQDVKEWVFARIAPLGQ